MSLESFHPAVRAWFLSRFPDGPSIPQLRGWPAIRSGRHTLISAPTGSGKTLAAFLCAIDDLVRQAVDDASAGGSTSGETPSTTPAHAATAFAEATIGADTRRGTRRGRALPDETQVLYVSPLKALSNDVRKNLEEPLEGIRAELARTGLGDVEIRTAVRTGDTPAHERQAMVRRPPHILVTTPESLFILLTTERGRQVLKTVRTVIVDEIHAIADDKRGSHLALTLERLEHLVLQGTGGDRPAVRARAASEAAPDLPDEAPGLFEPEPPRARHTGVAPVRIGLSATVSPIEDVARFLLGTKRAGVSFARDDAGAHGGLAPGTDGGVAADSAAAPYAAPPDCVIVDEGHVRRMDLRVEIPSSPLSALMSGEVWEEIYGRLAELILENRTTLVFVNTRRLAERTAHHLSKRLGEEVVTSHHGSLSRERRLEAEERLKAGKLRALVATASLELGIDIGSVDLVCQIGSPHTIGALLQRVGRSGRRMGSIARGRLFALSRDELVECAALLLSAREGLLDRLEIPKRPLDILAQQVVAAAATRDWLEDELFELVRGAYPFRDLSREDFDAVVRMLAEGYATQRGRRAAWIHYDAVNRRIRARRGARLAVVSSGGAIPDNADFQVVLEPEGTLIGSVNEDFAIESLAGDIFQLGNSSWRILRVESGRVRVEDARGQPPSMPFWLGEAPARTRELSEQVSRIRSEVEARLADGPGAATRWLVEAVGLERPAAEQIEEYLAAAKRVLTVIPTRETLVLERFFDEAGGMQLVVHSPYGGRINRAWGLALRKRFCRSFNFELQAAANEDAIVLSLGPQHSFPLFDVFHYLHTATARDLLVQALLAAPMFETRWRWNAARALGVLRQQNGRKVPPQLQRMRAADLLASAFPQAAACQENVVGDIEVPDHPIVRQTVEDCLREAMDIQGFEELIGRGERGELGLVARDVPEPSPLAHEILNARPYAFLDDAPAEERRTLAVSTRRGLDYRTADDLGTLDPEAIERVRAQAWPEPEDADEVHDALLQLGFVTVREAEAWAGWLDDLERDGRATFVTVRDRPFWAAAERLPLLEAIYGELQPRVRLEPPPRVREQRVDDDRALVEVLRGRMEALGPVTAGQLAGTSGLEISAVEPALIALETEGVVLRGHFTPGGAGAPDRSDAPPPVEWCDRRLLARIHRYTIDRLRSEIEPASAAELMRFLLAWQHLTPAAKLEGPRGLLEILRQLQGFEAPAVAWEREILPARLNGYDPAWLDALCLSGRVTWGRIVAPAPAQEPDGRRPRPRSGPVRSSPIAFFLREELATWSELAPAPAVEGEQLSHAAWEVLRALRWRGPSFVQELVDRTGLLSFQVERGLGELVSWGVVTADGFSGLRALLRPSRGRSHPGRRARQPGRGARRPSLGYEVAGRWSLLRDQPQADTDAKLPPAQAAPRPDPVAGPGTRREERVERLARQLLSRYGIVVRRLLEREPVLPPWRELLRILRRLEMRGEIRGGRFLAAASGEQFALPEAVELLRSVRRRPSSGENVFVNGGDPLNLTGILTPGARIPASPSNRVRFQGGVPVEAGDAHRSPGLASAGIAFGAPAA